MKLDQSQIYSFARNAGLSDPKAQPRHQHGGKARCHTGRHLRRRPYRRRLPATQDDGKRPSSKSAQAAWNRAGEPARRSIVNQTVLPTSGP